MLKILTAELLERLVNQGYFYCGAKTTTVLGEDAGLCITLVPLKQASTTEKFDICFHIDEEPRIMALGVDDTIILVDLSKVTVYAELN